MMDEPTPLPSDMNSAEQRRSSRIISTSQALNETPEKSKSSSPYVQGTPHAEKSSAKANSPVSPRKFRRGKSAVANGNFSDPVEEAIRPLTEGERQSWKGWIELESDPVSTLGLLPLINENLRVIVAFATNRKFQALFSYILREYGVKYIKCQEVIALDDDSLFYLLYASRLPKANPADYLRSKPVYGLIFLFKYRDDDADEDEDAPKCPNHVWFANQVRA
jgi:ubiquitin carboxyl-terminal hydrolase L5